MGFLGENAEPESHGSLRAACIDLLGNRCPIVFAIQVERVLRHIAADEEIEAISGPEDVIDAFRSRGLTPPVLMEALGSAPSPESLAVCFAACIYPNRAYDIPGQLKQRLDLFLSLVRSTESATAFLTSHQLSSLSAEDLDALLSDLSAAEYVEGDDPVVRKRAVEERKTGAGLYLATCLPDDVARIVANWREDFLIVRAIREMLPTCPSSLGASLRAGARDANLAGAKGFLEKHCKALDASRIELILGLEKHVWSKARCAPDRPPFLKVLQMTADFWESRWEKLISGFPHYAYRSHFAWWWRACVVRWLEELRRKAKKQSVDDSRLTEQAKPHWTRAPGLTKDELLFFREGYRLVRTSFYGREGGAGTEAHRRVVDDIWRLRLEKKLGRQEEAEEIQSIAARHAPNDVSGDTVNALSHRLRLRMWAYTLARSMRLSNEQIRTVKLTTQKGANERPFTDASNFTGVPMVASLARAVPRDWPLFWAYTVHRALKSKCDPQHPDPWDFISYVPDIWWWLSSGILVLVEEAARAGDDRVSRAAAALLQEPAVRKFVNDLLALETEQEAADYAAREGATVHRAARVLWQALEGLGGPRAFEICGDAFFKRWRKLSPGHWIAPVWYLTFLQHKDGQEMLGQLAVDANERQSPAELAGEMRGNRKQQRSFHLSAEA